ncbi:MAG: hypothetical protein U0Q15_19260 [Kineosporiaceae bacterium]
MPDSPKAPRTLAELEQLEARVHVPFDKLTYGRAQPPAAPLHDDYEREVRSLLLETGG